MPSGEGFGEGTWAKQRSHAVNSRRYCLQGGCWPLPPGRIKPTPLLFEERWGMGPSSKEATTAEQAPMEDAELHALLRPDP